MQKMNETLAACLCHVLVQTGATKVGVSSQEVKVYGEKYHLKWETVEGDASVDLITHEQHEEAQLAEFGHLFDIVPQYNPRVDGEPNIVPFPGNNPHE